MGAPVDIGALIKTWVTVSWQGQDRDWQAALPGQDHMDPFGFIGVAAQYIPAGAVSELAGTQAGGIGFRVTYPVVVLNTERIRGHLSRVFMDYIESAHDSSSRVGVRERLDLASAPASRRRARFSLC